MQKFSRANFLYRIGTFENCKVLLLWDKNEGNTCLTNEIENVVADIAIHETIDPKEYLIIYRDSEARWDGWDPASGEFYVVGAELIQLIATNLSFNLQIPTAHE